jgi:thiamine-phosphate pyrophosphorylase
MPPRPVFTAREKSVSGCRLYLITPAAFELAEFIPQVEQAFAGGDIACLQLRLKNASDAEIIAAAKALGSIARAHDAAFILNDRYDLIAACNADGVHLGQEDLEQTSLENVRRVTGDDCIIGVSAHASMHLAMEAGEQGADYVAFGAFFATPTKSPEKIAKWGVPEISLIEDWATFSTLPCVAIGGMLPENIGPLVRAGADFIAAITGVWRHPEGPKASVEAYNKAIASAQRDLVTL